MDDIRTDIPTGTAKHARVKAWLWFVGLWISGFISVAMLAYGFRFLAGLAYA